MASSSGILILHRFCNFFGELRVQYPATHELKAPLRLILRMEYTPVGNAGIFFYRYDVGVVYVEIENFCFGFK